MREIDWKTRPEEYFCAELFTFALKRTTVGDCWCARCSEKGAAASSAASTSQFQCFTPRSHSDPLITPSTPGEAATGPTEAWGEAPVQVSTFLLSCVSSRSPPWSFTGTRTLSWERCLSGTSATCPTTGWWWWGARDTRVTWTTLTPGTEPSRTSCTRCESVTMTPRIWNQDVRSWRQIHTYFILMTYVCVINSIYLYIENLSFMKSFCKDISH